MMAHVIDRMKNGIAICECLETEDKLYIEVLSLPEEAREGDAVMYVGDGFTVGSNATTRRKAELSDRLERIFEKYRLQ